MVDDRCASHWRAPAAGQDTACSDRFSWRKHPGFGSSCESRRNPLQRHNVVMRGNAAALHALPRRSCSTRGPVLPHLTWLRCCICRSLVCFALGMRTSSDRMQAGLTGPTRGPAHPTSRTRDIVPCSGLVSAPRWSRTPSSIKCCGQGDAHVAYHKVPDVLRSLVKNSDFSLGHRPREYTALVACGVGPSWSK